MGRARARQSHAEVRAIAVDETATLRGHHHLTVSYALDAGRLLFAAPEPEESSLGTFSTDLSAHGGQPAAVTHLDIDISRPFRAAAEYFPKTTMCFDRFHVVALGSKALDEVRRAKVKSQPEIKGTHWSLLKSHSARTISQLQTIHWLQRSNLKTARA